jgi:hypothetical protein
LSRTIIEVWTRRTVGIPEKGRKFVSEPLDSLA